MTAFSVSIARKVHASWLGKVAREALFSIISIRVPQLLRLHSILLACLLTREISEICLSDATSAVPLAYAYGDPQLTKIPSVVSPTFPISDLPLQLLPHRFVAQMLTLLAVALLFEGLTSFGNNFAVTIAPRAAAAGLEATAGLVGRVPKLGDYGPLENTIHG